MGKKFKAQRPARHRSSGGGKELKPQKKQGGAGIDFWWLLPALVLGVLVYINALGGEFVYDDLRQIVRNTLIQDGSQFWHALTSDVWAFKGGDQAVSNYWRPSFVFWMILNFRCFGLGPVGWHLTNILLHVAVVALGFALLRRLRVSPPVAGAIALIFAVHPAHSESVAWISGAPDLILGAALLGSIWFVTLLGEKKTPFRWGLAIALYLVALGAKEVAILYPVVVMALLREDGEKGAPWSKALSIAWPFAGTAVVYLLIRHSILGTLQIRPEGGASLGQTILSLPAVFTFYLRQMVVPIWIGPSYPLRAVTTANAGLSNCIVPLVITIAVAWWAIWMARRTRIARFGLALFVVPLLPAMNISAFQSEQLVHDRYLYLPLLGFLILLIPALASLLQRLAGEDTSRGPVLVFGLAAILTVPLAAATVRYNRAWTSNLALWEWGVQSDPNSAYNYQQYGVQLNEAKKLDEAVTAFNRSIEIHPMPATYLCRATALIDQNHFFEAERDLQQVISKKVEEVTPYTMYQSYERRAVSLTRQNKLNEAANSIVEARQRLPQYTAALTEKLAIVLYQGGQKDEALKELNAVRAQSRTEALPESRMILFRLGMLNVELGHRQDAVDAFREFLSLTQGMLTPDIEQARSQSKAALGKLGQ